jgi:8-oxo-dGTP diphosphatase
VTQVQPAAPPVPVLAPTHPVDVFVLLIDDGKVLLGLRAGTGYADGFWVAPSGKVELGEDVVTAIRREAAEEIGVHFDGDEPRFVAVVHHRNPEHGRVGLVFAASFDASRHGEPVNREPHKCAELRWFALDALPADIYPSSVAAINAWRTGTPLHLSGWEE